MKKLQTPNKKQRVVKQDHGGRNNMACWERSSQHMVESKESNHCNPWMHHCLETRYGTKNVSLNHVPAQQRQHRGKNYVTKCALRPTSTISGVSIAAWKALNVAEASLTFKLISQGKNLSKKKDKSRPSLQTTCKKLTTKTRKWQEVSIKCYQTAVK